MWINSSPLVALRVLNANGASKHYLLQQEMVISGTFKNKFLSNKTVTIGKNSCLILQNISGEGKWVKSLTRSCWKQDLMSLKCAFWCSNPKQKVKCAETLWVGDTQKRGKTSPFCKEKSIHLLPRADFTEDAMHEISQIIGISVVLSVFSSPVASQLPFLKATTFFKSYL